MKNTKARMILSTLLAAGMSCTLFTPVAVAEKPKIRQTAERTSTFQERAEQLLQECKEHPEAAKSDKGWIKNRFESCHHKRYDLVVTTKKPVVKMGTLDFDRWVVGIARNGSRRIDYQSSIENIETTTAPGYDSSKWSIELNFSSVTYGSGNLVAPERETRKDLLTEWRKNPRWHITYTSPEEGATEPYKTVEAGVFIDMTIDAPEAESWQPPENWRSKFRFDSAGKTLGKPKGTVLTEARVEIPFSLSSSKFPESARHYSDAIKKPVTTFPSIVGKNIPGIEEPLHRTMDKEQKEANNRAAIRTCKDVWGSYDGQLMNCDEYPFASTEEGAANSNGNYSARLIDAADNQAAGRWLNKHYQQNRIIDGDPFYITIVP
ncbi:NucA/NucB deoxyribonuclease domain-containing protein [Actinopolyspora sp. H202]|uniref:NucA/NucB deoxyribonuclease domain-containing protein n=1 Tax=Actinopolyspora sp. H202 TaxID=1500456 RepID=UPI003EE4C0D4